MAADPIDTPRVSPAIPALQVLSHHTDALLVVCLLPSFLLAPITSSYFLLRVRAFSVDFFHRQRCTSGISVVTYTVLSVTFCFVEFNQHLT